MRFLVDESLSSRVAQLLVASGHDGVHVLGLGLGGAPDEEVMRAAGEDRRVLVAADTDFGELLARGRLHGPSLILLRRAPRRAEAQVSIVLAALTDVEESLISGAIVRVVRRQSPSPPVAHRSRPIALTHRQDGSKTQQNPTTLWRAVPGRRTACARSSPQPNWPARMRRCSTPNDRPGCRGALS